MGFINNVRARAAERAAEAKRQEEEKCRQERERLSLMSDREILIEIRMLLEEHGKRLTNLEQNVNSMAGEVEQMYINDLTNIE